jgi:hypothetical protein
MLMSSASLRYTAITLSFLPYKRDHRVTKSLRSLRLRASRRRAKQALRQILSRMTDNGYARAS